MPMGTYHELFGFLQKSKNDLVLITSDGRRWNVSAPFSAERYVGNEVRIFGLRGPVPLCT